MIHVQWVPLRRAKEFIREHHRHRPKLTGAIVALGAFVDGELVGVVTIGRPIARMDGPGRMDITRLCTNGHRNACSKLYAKAKRLGQALGFVGIKTLTLLREPGSSLRAVGAKDAGTTRGGRWTRKQRQRADSDPARKRRWQILG